MFQGFSKAKSANGGSILSSSQFSVCYEIFEIKFSKITGNVFFKNFSKILVNPIPGQTYSIVSIADNSDYYIRRVIYINSGNVDLTVTLQKNGVGIAEVAQTLVPANTAIVKNLISTLSIDAGIYFDAYIDPVGATGSGNLQVSLFYR